MGKKTEDFYNKFRDRNWARWRRKRGFRKNYQGSGKIMGIIIKEGWEALKRLFK
jgi:hypothetical protein